MANLLIIDDEQLLCDMLSQRFSALGHTVNCAQTLRAGWEQACAGAYDVIFLDLMMPDGNGLDLLPQLRQLHSTPEIIVMTGLGDADKAEKAIRDGAWDYFRKGASANILVSSLEQALSSRTGKAQGESRDSRKLNTDGIVARSPEMRECLKLLSLAVDSDANVLITGETGTGKELFARAVHYNSKRAKGPFVVVDCAALPENLVESMLLGHEKGSFTGADCRREGLIKQADNGTLFLDEIGELPLTLQKAFLRVLHERCFRPIGSSREVTSNFRLIAATNRSLEQMVMENSFRQDLLYRIKALTIELPPLRQRKSDIDEIVRYFVSQRCKSIGVAPKQPSAAFLRTLARYDWPGNIRELIHAVDGAISLALTETLLYPAHLPTQVRVSIARAAAEQRDAAISLNPETYNAFDSFPNFQEVREAAIAEAEEKYLKQLLAHTQGNIQETCRIAGLSRSRLYAVMKKYCISKFSLPVTDTDAGSLQRETYYRPVFNA